jgi:hypothetical protein
MSVAAPAPQIRAPGLSAGELAEIRSALLAAVTAGDDLKEPLWGVYQAESIARRDALRALAEGPGREAAQLRDELRHRCLPLQRDLPSMVAACIFWLRLAAVLIEPRQAGETGDGDAATSTTLPFVPMPHQEQLVWAILGAYLSRDSRDRLTKATVFIEKSRDMGATWVVLAIVIWLWLYETGFTCLLGSRVETLVEKNPGSKNEDTLLGRCEVIAMGLPDWLRPEGVGMTDRATRQAMLWVNPATGNRLTGESANANFGRQQRMTCVVFDELAFAEHQRSIIRGTADTCRLRIFLTSPDPDADACKELMRRPGVTVVTQDWRLHPDKTVAWYERQREDRSEEEIANELDLSWEGGAERRIYPEWDDVPKRVLTWMPGWTTWGGIDFGRSDPTAIIIGQQDPATGRVRILASYMRAGEAIDFFLPFFGSPIASGLHTYGDHERLLIDQCQQWNRLSGGIIWFGDPAGAQISQSANTSVLQQLAQRGIVVTTNPKINSHDERQTRTKLLLRVAEVNAPLCTSLDLAMRNYRRPARRDSVGYQKKALHAHSHLPTALEYVSVNRDMLTTRTTATKPLVRHAAAYESETAPRVSSPLVGRWVS